MSLRVECLCIDSTDPRPIARFWSELLGWRMEEEDDGDEVLVVVSPEDGDAAGHGIRELLFCKVAEAKTVKNRLHIDLRPDDQEAEVRRAEALGARRVDIGQGDQTWVVLADPDGNEFCILRKQPPEEA